VKTVERTIGGETKQVEWIGGFDAKPYMESASWGEPKYKKVSDPDTSQKVYHGDGCKVHPAKKATLKFQGESDPDSKVNTGLHKSTRAAVAVIRPKGSDYLPVIEAGSLAKVAPIKPDNLEEIPALPTFAGISDGISAYGSGYWSKLSAHKESAEYKQAEQTRAEVRARNEIRENEYLEELRRGVVAEDTAAFAYKRFRLEASGLVESAKRNGTKPARFFMEHGWEIQAHAMNAADKSGVSYDDLTAYIRNAGHGELAEVIEQPGLYKDARKPSAASKPKTTRKGRPKKVAAADMSDGELERAKAERLAAYLEIVQEQNKRLNVNAAPEQPPEPDPGSKAPAPEYGEDTVKITPEPETVEAAVVETKAQRRAAMREAKAARKAQRREWRKRQRAEARAA
jgi:hypothetical protein